MRGNHSALVLAVLVLASVAACSGGSGGSTTAPAGGAAQSQQFTGVALPADYSVDANRSLALGAGDRWIGRIAFTSGMSSDEVFDFYRREMPKYGWSEGAVVRSATSLLTFTSPATSRIAVVQITSRTLGGAAVEMVVSPASDTSEAMGAPSSNGGRAVSGRPSVTSQSLQ
ncbi:MAG TPA: hypothetical protein VKY65_02150 [Alphaproteobacteria bacterium]|nr:hypothetical protein [Alphaproteobacteria bacterium]